MEVTDRDIENLRRISEQVFEDRDHIEIDTVKDTKGDVMVSVNSVDTEPLSVRNAFAGGNLRKYLQNGYVAVAVGGGEESHSAWFERADAVEFGSPGPKGEFDLKDDWSATVGTELIVTKDGDIVAHVRRDGWKLDRYPLYHVLPYFVSERIKEHGFEPTDELRHGE